MAIFAVQGNRNPFIDHPEWASCVFEGACVSPATSEEPSAQPIDLAVLAAKIKGLEAEVAALRTAIEAMSAPTPEGEP